ncbi:GNAT family N-acetyltransferase [uncultured Litoreibacter sp.]|uniref:GNAT family N-acetyltransferase n=1 Tax=uncultured Litoreibacter sp. TaxID=1392394 RepID=UPI0026386ABA|nr:GNAT family N-acetyltransferase [uncultured Litoreibacter sp.]
MLRPLQQHPHFADCLRAGGREVVQTDAGVMLLRQFGLANVGLVSRGSAEMLEAQPPARTLRLFTPDYPIGTEMRDHGFARLRPAVKVAEWDISGPDLRSGLRKTWRHALERADGLKLALTHMPDASNHWLLMAEQRQARDKRYRALPLWLTRAWATLHPKDSLLIEARAKGAVVAGMVFLRHGEVATYHISFTTPLGRQMEAHRVMLWRAAAHFASRGVVRLDLGTLDIDSAPGLARFKLGTGAQARALGGTWVSVPGLAAVRRQFVRQFPSGKKA